MPEKFFYGLRFASMVTAVGCALTAGCTVGPDYGGPPEVASNTMRSAAFAHTPAGSINARPTAAQWWHALGDAQLDTLIQTALVRSPDILAARARLLQARASLRDHEADRMPTFATSVTAVRTRSPNFSALSGQGTSASGRGPLSLYMASFDASWEIDLFGGTRRAVEAATDEAQAVAAQLADTHVQLAAEVAQVYIDLRDAQTRAALVRASAKLEADMLALTQERRRHGVASELDVERLRAQLDNTQAQVPLLDAQITESLDQLAILTGRAPGTLDAELLAVKPLPSLPAIVKVGNPATLLASRPDVRAAERRLASRTAQIGFHESDWFPKISLFGELGFSAANPGHLVRKENATWLGIPRLQWSAFDFGRVAAGVAGAKAARDEAEAQYRGVVLGALRDADVALSRYGYQRRNVVLLSRAEAAATRAAALTQQRYQAGTASTLDWLDAERTRFSAEQNQIAGSAKLIRDYVSLQKALGLGWQTRG